MARKFADITFTPSVKAAQEKYGSRQANMGFEMADDARDTIGDSEAQFIEARDGFYQATVSQSNWPYVQFRGGPAGFLKVLDDKTIGYADFRGNIQYLSVGNLGANDRVSIILMDYPNQRRLKIWARARIVEYDDDPDLVSKLEIPTYRARVERAIILTVEALDWNCPQHITPRYTQTDIESLIQPLKGRIAELEANAPKSLSQKQTIIGNGPLDLTITGIRQLTPNIRAYELRRLDFGDLPAVEAGSHIQIPVILKNGNLTTRNYSISSNPKRRDLYEIAVQLEENSTGGSKAIHEIFEIGTHLKTSLPVNAFPLHTDDSPAILIAGGVGLTPLKPMAQALKSKGQKFSLHYAARSQAHLAYQSKLALDLGDDISFYPSDEGQRINVEDLLKSAPATVIFYVCGPERLIEAVQRTAEKLQIDPARIRFESFTATAIKESDMAFEIHLKRSNKTLNVEKNETILDTLIAANIQPIYGCRTGTCGTCATKVIEGIADHRDTALSSEERNQADLMCPCVSRTTSDRLVLDL